MSKNGSNEFKFGQQVWLYAGAKLETWFLGKNEKDVLLSTEHEAPGTLYRMKGTATLFHDEASAIQSRVEILLGEIQERDAELKIVRQALKAAQEKAHPTLPRTRHSRDDNGPGL